MKIPVGHGFMTGGKVLIKPFIKQTVTGCIKMSVPLPGEGAARGTQRELRAKPNVFKARRYSRIIETMARE